MSIKLRKLLETDNMINEKEGMPPWKLEQIAKEIVRKYFASVYSVSRMSHTKGGVEQNKMLRDLTTSIKGAIKSVIKNYPNVYSLEDTETMWKNK
jgi:ribosomal protein S25